MRLLSFVVVVAASMVIAVSAGGKYTTKYDNVNIDEILKSERLFDNYYECLIDKGSCPPDARELKSHLPDALQTECSKCSANQKAHADKVIRYIIDKKPKQWKILQAKYDPGNIYYNKYKDGF